MAWRALTKWDQFPRGFACAAAGGERAAFRGPLFRATWRSLSTLGGSVLTTRLNLRGIRGTCRNLTGWAPRWRNGSASATK
ncbi:unnamed protein product [Amoebophrya sp. A120]|nr:unnamed protein product [Amoebophrya sp. A120]|eukprot:GSA120T00001775001.1